MFMAFFCASERRSRRRGSPLCARKAWLRTIIPAKHGRPSAKLPAGHYRRLMRTRFDRAAYRRRSQVETAISMIKRRQAAYVRGRSHHSRCRDLRLLAQVEPSWARNRLLAARGGETHEWHLVLLKPFQHIAFRLMPWLRQQVVPFVSTLLSTRLKAVRSISDAMNGDGIE